MWKVGGIKTELTRGQNFSLYRQLRKSFNDWFTEAEIFRKTLRHRKFSTWKFLVRGQSEPTRSQLSEYLYEGGRFFFYCLWTIVYGKKWFKWASSILKIVGDTFFFNGSYFCWRIAFGRPNPAGLHKLCHPTIQDGSMRSKFGARGEQHGDVFLFSNLGALWFSENLIRYSLHVCLREVKNSLFSFRHSYFQHFSWRF